MVPVPRSFNLQLFSEEFEEGEAILHVKMDFNLKANSTLKATYCYSS